MKRHPALVALSHDHHTALFIALQLRRADDDSAEQARSTFSDFWSVQGNAHFRLEEEVLFPSYAAHGPAHHPLVARALCDHVAIRRLASQVTEHGAALTVLGELGTALEQHIRFEERELFVLIEETMPEEALHLLADALAQADPQTPHG